MSSCKLRASLTEPAVVESTVSQRRELDSERQTKETEEQRKQREVRWVSIPRSDELKHHPLSCRTPSRSVPPCRPRSRPFSAPSTARFVRSSSRTSPSTTSTPTRTRTTTKSASATCRPPSARAATPTRRSASARRRNASARRRNCASSRRQPVSRWQSLPSSSRHPQRPPPLRPRRPQARLGSRRAAGRRSLLRRSPTNDLVGLLWEKRSLHLATGAAGPRCHPRLQHLRLLPLHPQVAPHHFPVLRTLVHLPSGPGDGRLWKRALVFLRCPLPRLLRHLPLRLRLRRNRRRVAVAGKGGRACLGLLVLQVDGGRSPLPVLHLPVQLCHSHPPHPFHHGLRQYLPVKKHRVLGGKSSVPVPLAAVDDT